MWIPCLLSPSLSCFPFFETKTLLANNNSNFAYILDSKIPVEFVEKLNTSSCFYDIAKSIDKHLTVHIKSIIKEYDFNDESYPDSSGLNGIVNQEYTNLLQLWQLCHQAEKEMLNICPALVFSQTASHKMRMIIEQIHRYVSFYNKKEVPYQVIA